MYETLELKIADSVATVTLNRPDRLNAINRKMIDELHRLCRELDGDSAVRAVILGGHGRAFCAGADITVLDGLDGTRNALDFIQSMQELTNALEAMTMPTIAAINGIAFGGGCELALACDLRLMANNATIGVPEIKIGLLPGAGGTQRLSRLLPAAVAKEMIYFGDPIDAERAVQLGLVNQSLVPEALAGCAQSWATKLAALPPLALRAGKSLINGAALHGIHDGVVAERQAMGMLFGTADSKEGVRAFLEKRRAEFTGR